MEYLPVNIAPQGVQQGDYFPTVIGPYDEWAISYGYKLNPDLFAPKNPFAEKVFLEQTKTKCIEKPKLATLKGA